MFEVIEPAPTVYVYDDADIETLMNLDGLNVEDWITHMGFNCKYFGSGIWQIDGAEYDSNDVRAFLKRQKGYQP